MGSDLDSSIRLKRPEVVTEIERLAHDLSNQIMVIQGNASLLQLKTGESPELHDLVEQILGACHNAVTLTRQVGATAVDLQDIDR